MRNARREGGGGEETNRKPSMLNTVFSLVFRVTGKSVFWTGKAALLKIFFCLRVELSS